MSTVTITLPDPLDAALGERARLCGAQSKEAYLLRLVESDCAAADLETVLTERLVGPFGPLDADWKARVRPSASLSRPS